MEFEIEVGVAAGRFQGGAGRGFIQAGNFDFEVGVDGEFDGFAESEFARRRVAGVGRRVVGPHLRLRLSSKHGQD